MAYLRAAGERALKEGNRKEAKATYRRLWLKERRGSDLIQLLKILQIEKDYNSAVSIIKELPQEAFKIKDISLQSSSILRETGRHRESIRIMEDSLQWNNDDPELLLELARNYSGNAQFGQAIKILEKLRDISPNSFSIWFNLGVAYSNSGQLGEGLKAFTHANSINPEDEVTAANRIVLLKENKTNYTSQRSA